MRKITSVLVAMILVISVFAFAMCGPDEENKIANPTFDPVAGEVAKDTEHLSETTNQLDKELSKFKTE